MTNEHQKYIKNYYKKKYLILIIQIILFITFILLWQILSDKNYINSFITSSPLKIIKTLVNLYKQNNLFTHIWITVKETLVAFFITGILSFILSILFYRFNILYKIFDPFLTILNSLPKVSLGPIIIIWFGANYKSIIVMAVLISLIVSIQNIYNGFINTDKLKIKLLNTFSCSKLQEIIYVVIPYNKENILNTLKINISMCLIGVITGEFLTSKAGIGYLILYGSQIFNLNLVMSGIVLLMIISFIMYYILAKRKNGN